MRRLLLALVILLGAQTLALAQSPLAPSLWKNQRGSTLEIQWAHPSWDGVTHFGGTFVNHPNGFECKGIPYLAYGGELRGAHATFKVAFHKCATYATWKGHLRGRKMYMPWSLVYYVNGTPNYLKGVDVFWRIR
jgi:hypothetical protein